jgi:hypothetical protein
MKVKKIVLTRTLTIGDRHGPLLRREMPQRRYSSTVLRYIAVVRVTQRV